MSAHVADEIGVNTPVHEAPPPVTARESVVIAPADDGLQSHIRQRLKRGEVRTRDRRTRLLIDLDSEIGRDVFGPWSAVVIDDHVVAEHCLDRLSARHRPGAAREGGVRKELTDRAKSPSSTSSA